MRSQRRVRGGEKKNDAKAIIGESRSRLFLVEQERRERDELLIDHVYEFVESAAGSAPAHFRLCRCTLRSRVPLSNYFDV